MKILIYGHFFVAFLLLTLTDSWEGHHCGIGVHVNSIEDIIFTMAWEASLPAGVLGVSIYPPLEKCTIN